ncbi:hypothetical protein Y032_0223g2665 [Ancylostoma ceylanicum]|nr:hypothetical protein Y032_0223g2665 [Ancylostoma ceylanicum]
MLRSATRQPASLKQDQPGNQVNRQLWSNYYGSRFSTSSSGTYQHLLLQHFSCRVAQICGDRNKSTPKNHLNFI